MTLLKNLLTNGAAYGCAHNAHMAELLLRAASTAESRRQIAVAMREVLRRGASYHNYDDAQLDTEFDSFSRLVQLNFLGMAMESLGIVLPNDHWMRVSNPFVSLTDTKDLTTSFFRFKRKHKVEVLLLSSPMILDQWLREGRLMRS